MTISEELEFVLKLNGLIHVKRKAELVKIDEETVNEGYIKHVCMASGMVFLMNIQPLVYRTGAHIKTFQVSYCQQCSTVYYMKEHVEVFSFGNMTLEQKAFIQDKSSYQLIRVPQIQVQVVELPLNSSLSQSIRKEVKGNSNLELETDMSNITSWEDLLS